MNGTETSESSIEATYASVRSAPPRIATPPATLESRTSRSGSLTAILRADLRRRAGVRSLPGRDDRPRRRRGRLSPARVAHRGRPRDRAPPRAGPAARLERAARSGARPATRPRGAWGLVAVPPRVARDGPAPRGAARQGRRLLRRSGRQRWLPAVEHLRARAHPIVARRPRRAHTGPVSRGGT